MCAGVLVEMAAAIAAGVCVACVSRSVGVRRERPFDACVWSCVFVAGVKLVRGIFRVSHDFVIVREAWFGTSVALAPSGFSYVKQFVPVFVRRYSEGVFSRVASFDVFGRMGIGKYLWSGARAQDRVMYFPIVFYVSAFFGFVVHVLWFVILRTLLIMPLGVLGYRFAMAFDVSLFRKVGFWLIARLYYEPGLTSVRTGGVVDQGFGLTKDVCCPDGCEGCEYRSWTLQLFAVSTVVGDEAALVQVYRPSGDDEEARRVKRIRALEGDALIKLWLVYDAAGVDGAVPGDVSARMQSQSSNEKMRKVLQQFSFYKEICAVRPDDKISAKSAGTMFEAVLGVLWRSCGGEEEREHLRKRVLLLLSTAGDV